MSDQEKKYIQEKYPTKISFFEKISYTLGVLSLFIIESIEAILIALFLCAVLYLFLITPHEVVGRSMMPTFINGEYIIANKVTYRLTSPRRGDVIIFKLSPTQDLIKRVIGVPGDKVSVQSGKMYINGEQLDESSYLMDDVFTSTGAELGEGDILTLKDEEFFVMGDNRPESSDSRSFGVIEQSSVKGKAWLVYFPFNRFRVVEHPEY